MNILSPKIKENETLLKATLEDQPICNVSEDLFGREQFAKTLVSNIYVHCQDTHSCVVIALDGQWGEGKTSLLNRIHSLMSEKISPEKNTQTKDDSIIQVRYNPWLCTNQESLLLDFFQHLLKGLKGEPFLKNKILTYAKRIMNPLSTLAGAIPIPGASAAVKAGFALGEEFIDNALEEKSLCDLKKEIDDAIGASNKHLIVYIDDLDRLDKEECHAVIKLIKQTADFKNTIYMVAMDMDHVAHSIEQFYGRNEQHSFGADYLQKIIQQPIRVPKFQKIHLSKYIEDKLFTKFIDKIVETAEPSFRILLEKEAAESKSKVLELTLPLIDTPRQVIQWINNLQFTLPNLLLTNEVNLTDFLLLSFLKVSFPDIYETIRSEKWSLLTKKEGTHEYTMAVYEDVTNKNNESTENFKEKTRTDFKEKLLKTISDIEEKKDRVKLLFTELLHNFFYDSDERSLEKSVSNKRLCTEEYYDKYFVYDTPEDVISEYTMQTFLSSLKENGTSAQQLLDEIIKNYAIEEINCKFKKIKSYNYKGELGDKEVIKLLIALSQTQNSREVKDYSDYLYHSLENFLSFTYDMIEQLYPNGLDDNSEGEQKEDAFMSELVQKGAFMFLTVLLSRGLFEGMGCPQEVYRAMVPAWIERYKKEDIKSIFEFDSTCSSDLLKAWKIYDEKDFEDYVEQQLYTNFENAKRFSFIHFNLSNLSKIKENSRQPNYAIVDNFNVFFKDLLDLDRLSNFLKASLKNNKKAVTPAEAERINNFIGRAN